MSVPSVKTLTERLNLDRDTALKVRGVLKGKIPAREILGTTKQPHESAHERKLDAVSKLIEGYGVEYQPDASDDLGYHIDTRTTLGRGFYYVDMGDTYNATIIRTRANHYIVACWGDLIR